MYRESWTNVCRGRLIELLPLLYGIGVGLIMGLSALRTESVEVATGMGIAVSVSVSLGGWLGFRLSLLKTCLISGWVLSLNKRIEALASHYRIDVTEPDDEKLADPKHSSKSSVFWWLCTLIVPMGITMTIVGAILAFIDFRVDIYSSLAYVPNLLTGLGLALFGIAGQCLYLWKVTRDVARLERHLDSVTSVHPVALQVYRLERAISSVSSIVRKLAGVRRPDLTPANPRIS